MGGIQRRTDYDSDNDGLIDVANLAQLNAVRWDLDGDGAVTDDANTADFNEADAYDAAFPGPVAGMGCPASGCDGYELTADLDFDEDGNGFITSADAAYWNGGAGWDPIGDESDGFSAVFEGNGNTIANLFIDRSSANGVALFGGIGSGGVVRNLGLTGVDISGNAEVGGLVADNDGSVISSYVTGTVDGTTDEVGGLVGENDGLVAGSYSAARVDGRSGAQVGGLVGANEDRILAGYATGSVSGSSAAAVGGLVGQNAGGTINASYSTGEVSGTATNLGGMVGASSGSVTVTASYWNTETSRQSSSAGGEGKTGEELRTPTAYGTGTDIYANWNLDLDGDSTPDDPWDFGADYNYPTLPGAGGKQKGPGPVLGLSAAPNDQLRPVVTWTATTDGGDGTLTGEYKGRFSTNGGTTWQNFTETSPTYTIAIDRHDREVGDSYRFEVWATGEGAAHTRGSRASIGLPGEPSLSLTSFDGRIEASWSAPTDTGGSDITGYRLDWRATGATSWTTLTLAATPTSRSFTGLTSGGAYEFRMAATNAHGAGRFSEPLTAIASAVVAYDSDGDGLIEIRTLAQLNAVRYDLDADGAVDDGSDPGTAGTDAAIYAAAFPQAATGMGCPASGCVGYELEASLDFDENGDGNRNDTYNTGEGWEPITGGGGSGDPQFVAVFEGNGNTIANLFIERSGDDRQGLFGVLGHTNDGGATVRNLILTGASVTGDDRIGILAGRSYGSAAASTIISNISVSGSVSAGDDRAGGLVGEIDGDSAIAASYSSAAVSGDEEVGGLVGESDPGSSITASYATGSASGSSNVGGLVGANSASVTASFSTGAVSGNGHDAWAAWWG